MHAWVLAEKGQNSTFDKTPMQLHFMDDNSVDWRKSHKEFCSTDRPILRKTKNSKYVLPFLSDHYEYLGSFRSPHPQPKAAIFDSLYRGWT